MRGFIMGIFGNTAQQIKNASERARKESDSRTKKELAQIEMDEDIYFREYEVKYQEKINSVEERRIQADIKTQNIKRDRVEASILSAEADAELASRILESGKRRVNTYIENKSSFEELRQLELDAGLVPTDIKKLLS